MPFPARLLTEGEEIVHESKQHWIALRDEISYTFGWLVLLIVLVPWLDFALDGWIGSILTLVWAGVVGVGIAQWYSTDLIVTTSRFIYRKGITEKSGYEVDLSRLLDISSRRSFLQQLAGAGDLLLDTGGHDGKTVIHDVPEPGHIISVVDEARKPKEKPAQPPRRRLPGEPPRSESDPIPSAPTRPVRPQEESPKARLTRAEQLEILARLHNDGKLTDEEFMLEKTRVLETG